MTYPFLSDLCESRLIPSQTSLKNWKTQTLQELCYLYILGLRVLLPTKAKDWARDYCRKTGGPNDFLSWRTDGTDLYAMLYKISDEGKLDKSEANRLRHWLRHISTHIDKEATHDLFLRLDSMFRVTDSGMRSLRRIITYWHDADKNERDDTITKLVQKIYSKVPSASMSEIMPYLKKLEHRYDDEVSESASSGATGAASVATVVGGLGAGFDPDGQWRSVYGRNRRRQKGSPDGKQNLKEG